MKASMTLLPLSTITLLCLTTKTQAALVHSNVIDTGQNTCYNEFEEISFPQKNGRFYGQDAQYRGIQAAYKDNGDGTVSDLNTNLMWSQETNQRKVSLEEAVEAAKKLRLGGFSDWRVPNIKELYSLIDFRGVTGFSKKRSLYKIPTNAVPYINTDFFDFHYGDINSRERFIDAQWLSSTINVSPVFGNQKGIFGVNFADGRIKCYGTKALHGRNEKKFYVRYVRGRTDYLENHFTDNGNGTITDLSTGLTWTQSDSGKGMTWEEALAYAEKLNQGGDSDWRLPNAKELQSIVDYTRSPDTTNSAAINPIFQISRIKNEQNEEDYPFIWTSTTHHDGPNARQAVYIALGRGIGSMHGRITDAHGAGCQRSDPKIGVPQLGQGPQGDAQRILNYVICVRGGSKVSHLPTKTDRDHYPNIVAVSGKKFQPLTLTFQEPTQASDARNRRPPPHHMSQQKNYHKGPPPHHFR